MSGQVLFFNRSAALGWGFMAIWDAGVCAMTYVFQRDGGFHQFDYILELGVVALFWMFGFAGTSWFLSRPLTRLKREADTLEALFIWPWTLQRYRTPIAALPEPRLQVEDYGREDETWFCALDLPEGPTALFSQHSEEAPAKAACERLKAALA